MGLAVLIFGLELPAVLALLDCIQRTPDEFPGGAADRRSWLVWLGFGVLTAWCLIGNGPVLAYYSGVIRSGPTRGVPAPRPPVATGTAGDD